MLGNTINVLATIRISMIFKRVQIMIEKLLRVDDHAARGDLENFAGCTTVVVTLAHSNQSREPRVVQMSRKQVGHTIVVGRLVVQVDWPEPVQECCLVIIGWK